MFLIQELSGAEIKNKSIQKTLQGKNTVYEIDIYYGKYSKKWYWNIGNKNYWFAGGVTNSKEKACKKVKQMVY